MPRPLPAFRPLLLALAVALTAVVFGQPEAPGQLACGGRLRLAVPEGWQVTPAGDAGAVLRPATPQGQPIEIVGWDVPRGGDPSPTAAAAAQETLLFRTGPYARRSATEYKTAAGDSGLLVMGQVKSETGTLQEAAFAAFCQGGRYYIIGTFLAEGTGPGALEGPFGQVLKSLRFETPPTAPVVPAPPADLGPVATTPPAHAAPVAEPVVAPPAPPLTPPTPAPGTIALPPPTPTASTPAPQPGDGGTRPAPPAHGASLTPTTTPAAPNAPVEMDRFVTFESSLGFRLEYPVGWKAAVVDGRVEIVAPSAADAAQPAAMAIIWPLANIADAQDPTALARQVLQQWDAVGADAATLHARRETETVLLAGTVGPADARRRLVAVCHVSGDSALLTAFMVRPEEFAARLPALTHILGSFNAGPWWTSEASAAATTLWRDTSAGALQTQLPAGWKARGGVQNYNGSWSVYLELTSTDDRHLCVTWQQPVTPLFRDLTPVLRNLGWQEGDKYVANLGDQPLRILTRLSPQDFLTRHWLPTSALRLQDAVIDHLDSRTEPAALVTGATPTALAALLHGTGEAGPRQRFCLVATADAPVRIGSNCWQAAVLQAEAPPGALAEALAVLRAVVTEATVVPDGPHAATMALPPLLEGARQALAALPAPTAVAAAPRDVLATLSPRGKGKLWLLSPAALQPWQHAAQQLQTDNVPGSDELPELQPAFWK